MKLLSHQQKGALYAISSGLCFGLLGYFGITLMHAGLSMFAMLFWRFLIATLFMIVVMAPNYKTVMRSPQENLKVLLYGMTLYSATAMTYFFATNYISTGLAMVIFFTYPAFVILLNVMFYKATINSRYYLAFLMILIGMIFLIDLHEVTFDLVGIGLSVLSSALYACYVIASKKSPLAPLTSTLLVTTGCMITCLVLTLLDGSFYVPHTATLWFNIVSIALICTALPIVLFLKSLKYISSEQASMLSVLEPVFVVIVGILLLGETINTKQIVGIIIILSGALTTILGEKKNS